jgi:hypothetical protein
LTAAEVLKHSTGTDCWSVIKGEVYDLTAYVKDHPGGAALIKAICGLDGSAAFAGEHAGAATPKNILAAFDKLPENLKGEGKGSVNEYIHDSTREKKWGYYPGEQQVGTKLFEVNEYPFTVINS